MCLLEPPHSGEGCEGAECSLHGIVNVMFSHEAFVTPGYVSSVLLLADKFRYTFCTSLSLWLRTATAVLLSVEHLHIKKNRTFNILVFRIYPWLHLVTAYSSCPCDTKCYDPLFLFRSFFGFHLAS